jgi:hypothetical protein
MTCRRRLPTALVALFVALASYAQDNTLARATGAKLYSFEDLDPGRLPSGFEVAETDGAGTPATWRVGRLESAPDGKQVLAVEATNSGSTFNLLLSVATHPADLQLSVWILARSGKEDQGGGLVWRAKDGDNYYITRWNPLESNLRLYKVVNGRRQMFLSADVKADAGAWHRLQVTMRGKTMTVAFDEKQLLRHEDETFSGAGKIGLWTKADASCSFDALEVQRPGGDGLVAMFTEKAPLVDGSDDDEAWKSVPVLEVRVRRPLPPRLGEAGEVQLRSLYTASSVYFLVRWRDETRDDVAHKPWAWNSSRNAYEEGPEREDALALAFEHTGPFDADMLSGVEATWDVWHWKAVRTNPQGLAMDRTHRYTRQKPAGRAAEHQSKADEATVWIARPEDAGDTVERKQPPPKERGEDRVPQYLPATPTGSAADVRAKGVWKDGWWTLELERKLDTGHADDTRFDPGQHYRFAVATQDRTGDMDKASTVIELSFRAR